MYNHYNYNNNIPIIMSYNTPYESVREFHEVFEHPTNDTPQTTIFDDKPDLVKLRIALIDEEFNEFKEACHNKDMTESLDALADMMYVIAGAAHAFGVNLDEAFARVHQSNMTKACKNEQDAIDTVEYIKQTQPRYNPTYKQSKDGKYWIVYDAISGKILKNKYYQAVSLGDLCNAHAN